MADESPASSPDTRRKCADCGREFDASAGRGTVANCCDACQVKRMTFVFAAAPAATPAPEAAKPWTRSRAALLWLLLIGAGATAGIIWRRDILHQYHRWTQSRHARRASQSFEAGDYAHAILDGRRALDFDPFDAEANRIIAKSFEAQGLPEAIQWRMRLHYLQPGNVENALAWARDAMSAGGIEPAEEALATLKPGDRNSADYHDIAAQIAMAKRDSPKAESHWSEAVRLDPSSEDFRMKLATLQIRSRSEKVRMDATKTLEALAEIPKHRTAALRTLIEDAMNHREFPRARKLADRLLACPDARFTDRLGRLAVLRAQDAPDAPEYLERLRDESLRAPEQFSTLLAWMNQNGLPLLVTDWVPGLPAELASKPPVCLAIADAYARDHEWAKLRAFAETAAWQDFDHVRLANLSLALENLGNVIAAEATWGRAIAECQNRPERLSVLVRLAQTWRWEGRMETALRKLSADERTPPWLLDAMWGTAMKSRDSAEMHRLSRLIVRARPRDPVARNNFIRLSLLRREAEGAPERLAAELFGERPSDITCATTHCLALFFQDKFFDAVQIMQSFPAADLRQPEIALYYGIFLHASGDSAKAEEFLALAGGAPLLHDEEELLARVKRESRYNTLTPAAKVPPVPPK
jgi:predicted Zn-dependent protease